MKPYSHLLAATLILIGGTMAAHADVIVATDSDGWSLLNPTTDPALTDADFNTTWYHPTLDGYSGANYDGPEFTGSQTAPFRFDTIEGLTGATVLTNKVTTYFYKVVEGGLGVDDLKLSMLSDDGAFVYLNGVLIARDGVSDPDTYAKFADQTANEDSYNDVALIGTPVLLPGKNLLAVSVHNRSATSSDIGMGIELSGDPILVDHESAGWAMLSPINPLDNDGYDPETGHASQAPDPDFNTTWRNQNFDGYTTGMAYNGPTFSTGHQGYFSYVYGDVSGKVSGLLAPNTLIPKPDSETRGAAYFIREIDGGANGFNKATFTVLADDGAFIYLNGNLVGVIGDLPSDATQDTWDKMTGDSGSETTFHTLTVSGLNIIRPNQNLLAVSLHQTKNDSSDLGFSLKLVGEEVQIPVITRGPYLQSGSHERMTVRWRTSELSNTILKYGDDPGNLTQTLTINDSATDHVATVMGLTAGTQYYYQIESVNVLGSVTAGADANHYFKTHPTPGSRTPARIWVIGDSGTTYSEKYDVYNAYRTRTGSAHTDAWLMLGDNAYNSGTDSEFQIAVFDSYPELLRNTVMWSCIGNHEYKTSNGAPYIDIHTFPTAGECGGVPSGSERYYSFDHGNIHFVTIDSQTGGNYDDTPGTGGMVDWLEMDLKATDKDWIIAIFHHGPYTKGSHDSDTESHHITIRHYVTPLLERYGVDLVFSGHSHLYERSMLVNGHHSNMNPATDSLSGDFIPGTHIVDGGNGSDLGSNSDPLAETNSEGLFNVGVGADGAYQKPLSQGETGAVYLIAGASGKVSSRQKLPEPDDDKIDYHPVFLLSLQTFGSCVITTDGANSINVQYIDNDVTVDGKGKVRDDFTIVKGTTIDINATDNTFGEHGVDDTASFTLTRTGAISFAETVNYTISGSTTDDVDYTPVLTGAVSFAADQTTKVITVTRAVDDLAEGNETLTVTLAAAQQAAGAGGELRDRYFLGSQTSGAATLADKPSQLWWFNQYEATTLNQALWDSDTDNDGLDRLMEYALGGTVGVNDTGLLPTSQFVGGNLELLYNKNYALSDLSYTVKTSPDLSAASWTTTGVTDSLNGEANPTGVEARIGSVPQQAGETRRFLRLEISQ